MGNDIGTLGRKGKHIKNFTYKYLNNTKTRQSNKTDKGYCDELKIKETDLLITTDKNKTLSNS